MGKWREREVDESNKEHQQLREFNPGGPACMNIVRFQGLQCDLALTSYTFQEVQSTLSQIYAYIYTDAVLKAGV